MKLRGETSITKVLKLVLKLVNTCTGMVLVWLDDTTEQGFSNIFIFKDACKILFEKNKS